MEKLPKIILDEWSKKTGASVMTTVDKEGNSNSIYATCVSIFDDEKILIANNYFNKTKINIENSCKGNFLFITEDNKGYQLKGTYIHHSEGHIFDDMKKWNPESLPGVGVAVLEVSEIYAGSEKIDY
jgi:uncharacterized protein